MSTCNVMVYGEFGQIPLSCDLLCNSFIYYHRLLNMPSGSLVKYVFDEMIQLNAVGYSSWVTKVEEMALLYNIDFESHDSNLKFKKACRKAVTQNFLTSWKSDLLDFRKFPILRNYNYFKTEFSFENYLDCVKIRKHSIALARFRCSSHHLAIETGRWNGTIENFRICHVCKVLDDEVHFVCSCTTNEAQRLILRSKLQDYLGNEFETFNDNFFNRLMMSTDTNIIVPFSNFIFSSFKGREKLKRGTLT